MAKRKISKKIRRFFSADKLHRTLAIVSGIFLVLMSISGFGLGLKSFYYDRVYYDAQNLQTEPLAVGALLGAVAQQSDTLVAVYGETKTLWVADIMDGTEQVSYVVNPATGQIIAPFERVPAFDDLRALHTRLLLDDRGRAFSFFASLCMVILCITGIQKLARKKGGYKKIFRPTPSDNLSKKMHTTVGIFVGVPLLILGFTGSYTAVQSIFKIDYEMVVTGDTFESDPNQKPNQKSYGQMAILQGLNLQDIKTITLPDPHDELDVITVSMPHKTIYLDRYTGAFLSSESYRPMGRIHTLMTTLHQTNEFWLWLVLWMLSALSVPMFIITGTMFLMVGKKRPKRKKS